MIRGDEKVIVESCFQFNFVSFFDRRITRSFVFQRAIREFVAFSIFKIKRETISSGLTCCSRYFSFSLSMISVLTITTKRVQGINEREYLRACFCNRNCSKPNCFGYIPRLHHTLSNQLIG